MLTFDSVKSTIRKRAILSYMEFNYMILQAYDFINYLKNKIVFYRLEDQINGGILLMVLN